MCCLVTTLIMLGPRAAVVLWWLIDPGRLLAPFGSPLWPILGIIFFPFSTLAYAIVWHPLAGLAPTDWVWLAVAFLIDIGSYIGSAWGNRDRVPGYHR